MARRKDLTEMADDYFDEEGQEEEEDEEVEYMIDQIQNIMKQKYKRNFLYSLFEQFDYDQEAILKHLKEKQQEKKKAEDKKQGQGGKKGQMAFPELKHETSKQSKKSRVEKVQEDLEEMTFVRKNSVKLSKDEIKSLPFNKEQWNLPYPIILPKVPNLDNKSQLPQTTNVGIIGHVDTGKSTLLGHLFHKMQLVDEKTIRKNAKESEQMGNSSFKYAWVLDQMPEERERGLTIDTNEKTIDVGHKKIHFIDTPGHTDFIFNTMKGASQVDVAVILVDAQNFNSDMEKNIYQKHLHLVQSKEVLHILICVNKMDKVDWKEDRFLFIKEQLLHYFEKENLFKGSKVQFLPISAFKGDNLMEKTTVDWYKGKSLIQTLEQIEHNYVDHEINSPLRIVVKNVFKGLNNRQGYGCTVKIDQGVLEIQDKVLIMPTNQVTNVTHIYSEFGKVDHAICGDTVDIILNITKEEDFDQISKGFVLCE